MKKLAFKYIVMVLSLVGLTAVVMGGGLYWALSASLTASIQDMAERTLTHSKVLGDLHDMLLVIIPVLIVIVGVVSLIILRKVARPEYELAQALQALGEGDFTAIPDAASGELSELITLLREASKKMTVAVRDERRLTDQLLTTAGELLQELDHPNAKNQARLKELAQVLLHQLEQLQILTTRYKIK